MPIEPVRRKPATQKLPLTPAEAQMLDEQIIEVVAAWRSSSDRNDLAVLARSCYWQGVLDGSNIEVVKALAELKNNAL